VNGESPAVAECSSTSRIFSPVPVPPGSRVTVRDKRARAGTRQLLSCVLLPLPSRPSKVDKFPRAATSEMKQACRLGIPWMASATGSRFGN